MTARVHESVVLASAATAGAFLGLPNPISAALYALIAAVIGWAVTWLLNSIRSKLGL